SAINDEALTRRYAEIIRQEYRMLGISQALSPMVDLAVEPRWGRMAGTFGSHPDQVRRMVYAYIDGMQNGTQGLHQGSVSAVVKHWVGYGAADQGFDSSNSYGKYAMVSEKTLEQHIVPFTGAFVAGVSAVMPAYSILKDLRFNGVSVEQVGTAFNRYLLQDLLRERNGFRGVIISDWAITTDCVGACLNGYPEGKPFEPRDIGMPWGVETLTQAQRFAKAINAGVDQFGGVTDPTSIMVAVKSTAITESQVDSAVQRLLEIKFALGLFDNPYVDEQKAATLPRAEWQAQADQAQRDSLVLLNNRDKILPLKVGTRVWLQGGIDTDAIRAVGLQVALRPENADVAIVRLNAPFEQPHKNYFFGRIYPEGSLAFSAEDPKYQTVLRLSEQMPTIVTVYLDRPAILTTLRDKAAVLIANFGVSDKVLLQALMAETAFRGKLPLPLPASMKDVVAGYGEQHPPLYPLGFGLSR
ncbi:MAG: glycoside hydrolase family 3 N-terminal domain-containing protein, partial [Enterobacteriaceae bacterium]